MIAKKKKKKKSRYNRGIYISTKTNQICKYRSGWELSYMTWLDANNDVLNWSYEKIVINYISNKSTGKIRKYYPDFLVEYSDRKEIVEIKPLRRLNQLKTKKKIMAAELWCSAHDFTFKILSEKELKIMDLI